jgi:hypothetical protein
MLIGEKSHNSVRCAELLQHIGTPKMRRAVRTSMHRCQCEFGVARNRCGRGVRTTNTSFTPTFVPNILQR